MDFSTPLDLTLFSYRYADWTGNTAWLL